MKKIISFLVIIILVLLIAFFAVFGLAKKKVIFINEWFVNEKNNTIGVDVSSYQSNVDMKALKQQDIEFVYIKASEGSKHQDSKFAENWNNAKEAGLPSGAYHFFSYDSPGKSQAENFISVVGTNLKGRMIPVVDVEYYGDKEENPPAKEDVVRELSAYLEAVEAQYGVKPMIYTRSDIYEKYLEGTFETYLYWISSLYTPLKWNYHGDWVLWQYLNRGVLDGYEGGEKYIDLNVLNKDIKLEDLIIE